ncbi:MAG: PH domain-containing protein [Anaerolineae bacterium]|jgi:hypothetical protein
MDDTLVFKPRPSRGWLSLLLLALALLLCSLPAAIGAFVGDVPWPVGLLTGAIGLGLGVPFLALAYWFPTMRYEIDAQALTLRYGPVLVYRIPLDEIQSMKRQNLRLSLWSSVRLPGVALFSVPYRELGQVKMCATAAARDILLIETADGLYGLTPADELELLAALKSQRG